MICQYCLDLAGENERRKSRSYLRQANELRLRAERAEAERDAALSLLHSIKDAPITHGGWTEWASPRVRAFIADAVAKMEEK